MESKRKNIYIVIFVITTIIAACLAVYFGVELNKVKRNNKELEENVMAYKQKIEENTIVENNKKEIEENVVEKIVEKSIFPVYDSTKFTDSQMKNLTDVFVRLGSPWDSAIIGKDGSVIVKVVNNNVPIDVKVQGLSGKCIDVIGGPVTDGASSVIYFLNVDGTVEKSNSDWYSSNKITSAGIIPDLKNIVRICYANNNKAGVPVAIDKDGKCYNLLDY